MPHCTSQWYLVFNQVGCPIRKFRYQRLFAPKPDLSQLITSFIASESLGIHRSPLFCFSLGWTIRPAFALLYLLTFLVKLYTIIALFAYSMKIYYLCLYMLSMNGHRYLSMRCERYGVEPFCWSRTSFVVSSLSAVLCSPRQSWTADLYIISVAL